jgi:hypothetical protein
VKTLSGREPGGGSQQRQANTAPVRVRGGRGLWRAG